MRHGRASTLSKIAWRCDRRKTYWPHNGNGDHVLRHGFRQTYPRIEAFGNDVIKSSITDDVEMNVRIGPKKPRKHRLQD